MLVKLFRLLKSDARLANAAAWSYCLQNFLEENSFEVIRSIFALLRSEKTTCYYCYHHRMTLIYAAHAAGRGILALKLIWGQMHPEHAAGFFFQVSSAKLHWSGRKGCDQLRLSPRCITRVTILDFWSKRLVEIKVQPNLISLKGHYHSNAKSWTRCHDEIRNWAMNFFNAVSMFLLCIFKHELSRKRS